jgi:hypothetical protein
MCITKDLYDEFISAIRWLKKNQTTDIKIMTSLEKIIFFNLWFVSYFVFRFSDHETYQMNNFIDFVDNIEQYNTDRIYHNIKNIIHYNKEENYNLCLKLLHKTKFDYDYLCIVEKYLSAPQCLDLNYYPEDSLLSTLAK